VNQLYSRIIALVQEKCHTDWQSTFTATDEMSEKIYIIPPQRTRYLSEIAESNRKYDFDGTAGCHCRQIVEPEKCA
jgi:methylmalonyl-CoA mutase